MSKNGRRIDTTGARVRYWRRYPLFSCWVHGVVVERDRESEASVMVEIDHEFRTCNEFTGRVSVDLADLRPSSRRGKQTIDMVAGTDSPAGWVLHDQSKGGPTGQSARR